MYGPFNDLRVLSPSLITLVDRLNDRKDESAREVSPKWESNLYGYLNGNDRDIVNTICVEISMRIEEVLAFTTNFTELPNFCKRFVLYDDEVLQIRAQVFHSGEGADFYIHNHGQAFISVALQGEYIHKVWQTNLVPGEGVSQTHAVRFREEGGKFNSEFTAAPRPGEPELVVCQPFQAGQTLYLSPLAKHKIVPTRGPLITLIFRDKLKRVAFQGVTEVYAHESHDLDAVPAGEESLKRDIPKGDQEGVWVAFRDAFKSFLRNKLFSEPDHSVVLERMDAKIHTILEKIEDDAKDMKGSKLILALSFLIVYWACETTITSNVLHFDNTLITANGAIMSAVAGQGVIDAHHKSLLYVIIRLLGCDYIFEKTEFSYSSPAKVYELVRRGLVHEEQRKQLLDHVLVGACRLASPGDPVNKPRFNPRLQSMLEELYGFPHRTKHCRLEIFKEDLSTGHNLSLLVTLI